ncbi:MAG: prepilin peptidase [Coriobacteriia bacterium]
MPHWFFVMSLGLFGLVFGSFANVVIWRVPRGESISTPGSHCPRCETPIAWYDNIPVVSWLVLRARCRHCGEPIAPRYPAVELASGALAVIAALAFGIGARAVLFAAFFWFLLVLSVIDLETFRLPNPLVGALAVLGIAGVALGQITGGDALPLAAVAATGAFASPALSALIGALLGGGLSAAIAAAYAGVRGTSGLGMGDVKLLAALGLFLGPYVLLALFVGSLTGAIGGFVLTRGEDLSQRRIPFGPWLSVGAFVTVLWGPAILEWYLRLIGIS